MQPEDQKEIVMNGKEVSHYLKIPRSTLYALTKQGKIRGVKVGKHWRYLRRDIHDYLAGVGPVRLSSALSVPPAERRKANRINCEIAGRVKVLLGRKGEPEKPGFIANLGCGGISFVFGNGHEMAGALQERDVDFEINDPVRVVFEIPGGYSARMELQGRIVHRLPGQKPACGIKFRNISLEVQEVLRNYVG